MTSRVPTSARPASADPAFDLLVDELIARLQAGQPPDWSALAREHPEYVGRLRSLAPALEALGEQGFKGFSARAWWGVFAPTGTPKPILDKLHAELQKVLAMPDVQKTLTESLGMDIVAGSPEATQKFLLGEMARWGKVVKDNNIKPY